MKLIAVLSALFVLACAPAHGEVLFVPDKTGNVIYRVGSSGSASEYATAGLNAPVAAVMDADRNLYVANAGDGSVAKVPYGGGSAEALASGITGLAGITLGPDGYLYVSAAGGRILKITAADTAVSYAGAAVGSTPSSLVFDRNGVLYVADPAANKIFAVSATGAVTEYSSDVVQPRALALDPNGNVLAADAGPDNSGRVLRFSGTGQATPILSNVGDVQGLASDRAGNLYVSLGGAGAVKKALPSGAVQDFASGLGGPAQLVAVQPQAKALAYKGQTIAAANGAEFSVNGARFAAFGPPATVASGYTAFQATLLSGTGGVSSANAKALWLSNPDDSLRVVARQTSHAPWTSAAFSAFSDPILNNNGRVAFRATLRGGDATGGRTTGIWSDAVSGDLMLVARLGDQPGGVDPGAKFTAFTQLALPEVGGPIFVATIAGAGVTAANNQGIWVEDALGVRLLVRKGDLVQVGLTQKKLASFRLFQAAPYLLGQTRSFNDEGAVAFLGTFTDGSQAECRLVNGVLTAAVYKGESAADPAGASYASFGLPAIGGAYAISGSNALAYRGVLRAGGGVGAANSVGIWAAAEWNPETLVARTGSPAPGAKSAGAAAAALFSGFSDPALNAYGEVAFRATLKPGAGGVTAANSYGIWSTFGGNLDAVVRRGDAAPDAPGAPIFTSLPAFVLADDRLVFTATIAGKGVTGANNFGVWAAEDTGGQELLLRKGDKVTVNGALRTISAITLFQALPFVTGQGRNVAADGSIAVLATFTDGSAAILRVAVV